jgi:ABC-type oligopeptide transport system substrate-binding subunit
MKNRKNIALFIALLVFSGLALTACSSPYQTRSDDVSGFNRVSIETFGEFIIEHAA